MARLHPSLHPALTLSGQVAALHAALRYMQPELQSTATKRRSTVSRADQLRMRALEQLAEHPRCTIDQIHARNPDTSRSQWPWLISTLAALRYVSRLNDPAPRGAVFYQITPAGRNALARMKNGGSL
jgi:DNA-binding MarR family transcriptional regulator